MKITAQEEYGLRILIRIAKAGNGEGLSIQALSNLEGLSPAYVAKLTRILRKAGYINSNPGNIGGYMLAKPAAEININHVLKTMGGALFHDEFCGSYPGALKLCTNSLDCTVRSLWQLIQLSVDNLLQNISLADLSGTEEKSGQLLNKFLDIQRFNDQVLSEENKEAFIS